MARRIATLSQLVARALRRPAAHKLGTLKRPKPFAWLAKGGPYDGHILILQDGTTAPLRVGDTYGRYHAGAIARYRRYEYAAAYLRHRGARSAERHLNIGTTVWKPAR